MKAANQNWDDNQESSKKGNQNWDDQGAEHKPGNVKDVDNVPDGKGQSHGGGSNRGAELGNNKQTNSSINLQRNQDGDSAQGSKGKNS